MLTRLLWLLPARLPQIVGYLRSAIKKSPMFTRLQPNGPPATLVAGG
jgi:hypothetical protein